MPEPSPLPSQRPFGSLALIAVVIAAGAGAFAYTGGWFSPDRLTPTRLVNSLAPAGGPALGRRRNHAKGICFTGVFEANGNGAELSRAQVLVAGRYPVLGRFNLGTPDPNARTPPCASGAWGCSFRRRAGRSGGPP
jgi:catalase